MATPSTQKPTPEHIFNTLTSYQLAFALRAAIELELFTRVGEGADQPAVIARAIGASERGTRILCDYMTIHGFLQKSNGKYSLSADSAVFLDKRSPAYLGTMAGFLTHEQNFRNFGALAEAVRKGGCVSQTGDNSAPNDEFWVRFAECMGPLAVPNAMFIAKLIDAASAKPMKILDIAAGHGMYGISIARQNANAEVTALDWAPVLEVAKKNAERSGVAGRYSTRPGSAFEVDMGTGYDYVLLTNIFHHFNQADCTQLMKRVHAALKPGGKAITVEFVPNEDRVTPPTAAAFSLIMLGNTNEGDAYTFSEYETMFTSAGFKNTSLHPVPEMPQQVILAEK